MKGASRKFISDRRAGRMLGGQLTGEIGHLDFWSAHVLSRSLTLDLYGT